ncbi:nuclear receptor coactivator 5-like [Lucilia sericata]|uniref:nuclear receptor coactivator 5-like n=1 Tax=Lucilia sericata TaxID=13632 RepID=UPI0018A87708|nr:nuclear receptor coactivator 5-like [Lucilia sericata]
MSEEKSNLAIIRDPNKASSRIFIGNLPQCTRDDLESICLPYGKVLATLVQKNFGFVQFESEEVANKVAAALNKSTFKGNTVTVRNAAHSKKNQQNSNVAANSNNNWSQAGAGVMPQTAVGGGGMDNVDNSNYNDCEIIVVDRKNTKYAEMIEDRLKRLNLRVDVLFPNADVPLGKVLSNIASRDCLYAILVTNQHEEHNSITVNILYGQPAEHRNMPVEDAIKLVSDDFRKKIMRDKAAGMANQQQQRNMPPVPMNVPQMAPHLPNPVPIIPANTANYMAPPLKERHPDAIQMLLNLLASNMPLTVLQYDRIIKYLQQRRELQLKVELGDAAEEMIKSTPDPEIELQKKILNILNKPSVAETHYELLYPNLEAVQQDERMLDLLRDVRVQKALDSLMDSNLVSTVENLMKF